jgi:hypothetical protein
MWWLVVASAELQQSEFTAPEITTSFDAMFKENGRLQGSHIVRDFGKQKAEAVLDRDPTSQKWFLTTKGKVVAIQFVAEAKAASNGSTMPTAN